jgi:hypothetical protein
LPTPFFLERVLAQTEKPAHIVRRRLEQAGFDVKDRLDQIGKDDISFLLKFQYKSQLLGENVRFRVCLSVPVDFELKFI